MKRLILTQSNPSVKVTWNEIVTTQINHSTPSLYSMTLVIEEGGTKIEQDIVLNKDELQQLKRYIEDALLEDEIR